MIFSVWGPVKWVWCRADLDFTHRNVIFDILELPAFQTYSICGAFQASETYISVEISFALYFPFSHFIYSAVKQWWWWWHQGKKKHKTEMTMAMMMMLMAMMMMMILMLIGHTYTLQNNTDTACFFNCSHPKNPKCQPVSKFWHLELFWWDLLCNLILRTFRGVPVKKTPCI